ncbi:MAG: hypothetical protein WBN81_12300 [Gammaproteobacteria bacterium]
MDTTLWIEVVLSSVLLVLSALFSSQDFTIKPFIKQADHVPGPSRKSGFTDRVSG